MNADSLKVIQDLIDGYTEVYGDRPAAIKMHPETMKLYFGDQIVTMIANVPIVRNKLLPYRNLYAFPKSAHEGDLA